MKVLLCTSFLLCAALLVSCNKDHPSGYARNQSSIDNSADSVLIYVEQMPELPGGGGNAAIVAAIQKGIHVPQVEGNPDWPRTVVAFVVGADGVVCEEQVIVSSQVSAYDKALLDAVRALPKFRPGYQDGKAVPVSFKIPISIRLQF